MPDQRLLEYNIARLRYKNPEVRLKSIDELRLLDDPAGWDAIAELYQTETEADVRRAAQLALVTHTLTQFNAQNEQLRLRAVDRLREIGDASVLPTLEKVYNTDPSDAVRLAARTVGYEIYTRNRKPGG